MTTAPSMGLFISFEGIDGAGKSTHLEALAQRFRGAGREVVVTREPGGTPLAERLRDMLLHEAMDSLSEALLMFASRREHIVQVIAPALRRGAVVITDRFTDSSFAYQGGGRGFDPAVLAQLEQWVQQVRLDTPALVQQVCPDLTLWFDLPAAVAAQRLSASRSPDKFESQSAAFFERVAQAYRERLAVHSRRMVRIDANRSADQVWTQVLGCVQQRGYLP
ncbi:MAG: dTMP kinase [Rhodoferax sp.]